MSTPEEEMELYRRQQEELTSREGGYANRMLESRGQQILRGIDYGYRGVEHTLQVLFELPRSELWRPGQGEDTIEGRIVRGALRDMGILPRFRDNDQTLMYQVSNGPPALLEDVRIATNKIRGYAEHALVGRDRLGQVVDGYTQASAYESSVMKERRNAQESVKDMDKAGISEQQKRALAQRLKDSELALADASINAGIRERVFNTDLTTLVLAGENISALTEAVGDRDKARALMSRLKDKREMVLRTSTAIEGINLSARYLHTLISMQGDIDGIIKVFTGPEAKIPTHLLRFLTLSDHTNLAVTKAFKELMKLSYPVVQGGMVVNDSEFAKRGINFSLAATKYTPQEREKFFGAWEDMVADYLSDMDIVDTMQLAEDGVSFATFLAEVFTLGGTAYRRNRLTGEKIDGNDGNGSMYDFGGVDTVDKVHQLHDRKQGEADKGRAAPRPGVIKGLSQELLYNIFQYTEAKAGGQSLGMSVLEAMTRDDFGKVGYTMRDFVENMQNSGHFVFMLYAFRACQISGKLDQLVSGRISAIQELGGGPEKLVQEMIDIMLGLHKAWQTLPYGSKDIPSYWGSYDKNDVNPDRANKARRYAAFKTIEAQRNMVNLFSDFYRAATAGDTDSGGYTDNPNFRGMGDLLVSKLYERLKYTNLMTAQQVTFAMRMGSESHNNFGGVLTEDFVYGTGTISQAIRKILVQSLTQDPESMVNIIRELGYAGVRRNNEGAMKTAENIINESADLAQNKLNIIADVNREEAGLPKIVPVVKV